MLQLSTVKERFPEARETEGKNGLEYNVHCPLGHKKGGIYKGYINAHTGIFYCQDCQQTVNTWQKWFHPLHLMYPEMFPTRDEPPAPVFQNRVRRGGIMWPNDVTAPGETVRFADLPPDHPAVQYMARREFDIEALRNLDQTLALYYCTKGQFSFPSPHYLGTTSGRLIIPVYMECKVVGWQARSIEYTLRETESDGEKIVWNGTDWVTFKKINGEWEDSAVPKYYNSPHLSINNTLFGFDMALNFKDIAVVEGALDYYKAGPACVAILGRDGVPTPGQIRLLKNWYNLFWLFDPGTNPGNPRLWAKIQHALSQLHPAKVYPLHLSNGKDPGANSHDQIWKEIGSMRANYRQQNQVHRVN